MKYNISKMKQFIIDRTNIQASIAVVLGSGMGGFCDQMDEVILIPYKDIPNSRIRFWLLTIYMLHAMDIKFQEIN